MRRPRHLRLAVLLLAGILGPSVSAQTSAVVGDWIVVAIGDDAVPADSGLTVTFAVDGTLSGSSGCNAFAGTYEAKGAALTVGPLRITRRGCPDDVMRRETAMMHVLGTARRIDPRLEGRVAISGNGGGATLLIARRPS